MDEELDLDPDLRAAATEHVLSAVYPDRLEAEAVDAAPLDGGYLVGVKAAPRGYVSTAKYALVTLDGGAVVESESCTGRALRAAIAEESDDEE